MKLYSLEWWKYKLKLKTQNAKGENIMPCGKREATTSITHLVKQVAREVLTHEIQCAINAHIDECHTRVCPGVGDRSGEIWTKHEDQELRESFADFLCEQAKIHGRSYNAIVCRIRDKELV